MTRSTFFTLSALLLILLVPRIGVAQVWRLASVEWPPYRGEALVGQGEALRLLRSELKKNGIELEVDFMPWNRAVKLARRGDYIGYFPAWPEEVGVGFVASPLIDNSSIALISYKNADIDDSSLPEALDGNRIGVVNSYVYPYFIQALLDRPGTKIEDVANDRTLIRLLAKKRVKLALTDPRLMQHYAEIDNYDNLTVLMDKLKVKPVVIALTNSMDSQEVITIINGIFAPK